MASDWPGRDKNVTGLIALSKNQPQYIEDEIDASCLCNSLTSCAGTASSKSSGVLSLMAAQAKKIGEQIPPDVDYADALRK